MKLHRPARRGWPVTLLLCSVGLVAVIVLELKAGLPGIRQPEQTGSVPGGIDVPALPEETFAWPPLEEFSEIVERPLFSSTRLPVAPEAEVLEKKAPPPAPASAPQLSLLGIVITQDQRSALFWDGNRREFVRATQGMDVSGWELADISLYSVVLRQGERRHELEMQIPRGATASAGRRRK